MIFQTIRIKTSILIFFLVIICHVISAQKRFELVVGIDPLHFQLDNSTEDGMGFYDIRYKRKITQSANLNFIYWPHANLGVSLGGCIRNFGSRMSYAIPDPALFDENEIVFSNEINFSARGYGPVASLHFRKDRFRIGFGFSVIDLIKVKYNKDYHQSGVAIFNPSEGTIAQIMVHENSYWHFIPTGYKLYHLNFEYSLTKNLHLKAGFETTLNRYSFYPIAVRISGFTADMISKNENQILNDFRVKDSYTALSLGLNYILGIGKKYE